MSLDAAWKKLSAGRPVKLAPFLTHGMALLEDGRTHCRDTTRYTPMNSKGSRAEGSCGEIFQQLAHQGGGLSVYMCGVTDCDLAITEFILYDEELIKQRGGEYVTTYEAVDAPELIFSEEEAQSFGVATGAEPEHVNVVHQLVEIWPLTMRESLNFNVFLWLEDGSLLVICQSVEEDMFPESATPIRIVKDSYMRLWRCEGNPERTEYEVFMVVDPRGSIPTFVQKMGVSKGLEFWCETIPGYQKDDEVMKKFEQFRDQSFLARK